jgi:hypothetical protein
LWEPEKDFKNDFYTLYKRNGIDRFTASFVKNQTDTFDLNLTNKMLKIHSIDSSLNIPYNTLPLIVDADGYGVIDADIIDRALPLDDSLKGGWNYNFGKTLVGAGTITAILDQSGNDNNFAYNASGDSYTTPDLYPVGDSAGIHFNGTADNLIIKGNTNTVDFMPYEGSFTIDFTYRGSDKSTASRMVQHVRTTSEYYWSFLMNSTYGSISFAIKGTTGTATAGSTLLVATDNEWHHIAVVVNRNPSVDSISYYFDGVKYKTASNSCAGIGSVYLTDAFARFAMNGLGELEWTTRGMNYFSRALSDAEISELYQYWNLP